MPRYIKFLTHPVSTLWIGAILASSFGLLFDQDFGESVEEHIVGIFTVFATLSAAFFALQGPLLQIKDSQETRKIELATRREVARTSIPSIISLIETNMRCSGVLTGLNRLSSPLKPEEIELILKKLELSEICRKNLLELIRFGTDSEVAICRHIIIRHTDAFEHARVLLSNPEIWNDQNIQASNLARWALTFSLALHLLPAISGKEMVPKFLSERFIVEFPEIDDINMSESVHSKHLKVLKSIFETHAHTKIADLPNPLDEENVIRTSLYKNLFHKNNP